MSLALEIQKAAKALKERSILVNTGTWQSVDISNKPDMWTYEILNYMVRAQIIDDSIEALASDIKPNLPWAEDHFQERIGGKPLNPGVQWANWPWGHSANKFRNEEGGKFSHTYMERLWPKFADNAEACRTGIRYRVGDLNDVVDLLLKTPNTRQAYLPIWFPEDTGNSQVRVPCTLGYHFIHRNGFFHMTYYIRSCDFYRHFQDDIYLAVRLMSWVLAELQKASTEWQGVKLGLFTMHIVSFHLFVNDYITLWGKR